MQNRNEAAPGLHTASTGTETNESRRRELRWRRVRKNREVRPEIHRENRTESGDENNKPRGEPGRGRTGQVPIRAPGADNRNGSNNVPGNGNSDHPSRRRNATHGSDGRPRLRRGGRRRQRRTSRPPPSAPDQPAAARRCFGPAGNGNRQDQQKRQEKPNVPRQPDCKAEQLQNRTSGDAGRKPEPRRHRSQSPG